MIDHGLVVTPTLIIHPGAKPVENIVVDSDGDAGLGGVGGYNRATDAGTEIIASFPYMLLSLGRALRAEMMRMVSSLRQV